MKLAVDGMLGRLARWLRVLGHDAFYDPRADDDALVHRARAEGRIILTRDTGLARRPGVRTLLITGQTLEDQLAQVLRELRPEAPPPFSRCALCNIPLLELPKDEARTRVPPFVLATQEDFKLCPQCGRIYWRGTHWQRMNQLLTRLAIRPPDSD